MLARPGPVSSGQTASGVRRYAVPVEVSCRDGQPQQLLWHERLYVVREVLAHWVRTAQWWSDWDAELGPARDREWEFWRLEIAAGWSSSPAVVDLGLSWSTGHWSVCGVLD